MAGLPPAAGSVAPMGRRACLIVLDAVGAGALPDADAYGDAGSSTLQHVAEAVGGLDLPNMQALGLGNVLPLVGCPPRDDAPSVAGRLREHSAGKDTTTGHWELMGVITEKAMPTYPDGFPDDVIDAFSEATGRGVIGNVAASGTEIIERLGEEHQRTGKWIVYTSADSVFQVAAHEQTVPLEELYEACRIARRQLVGEHAVGRVIARPFEGEPGAYRRTAHRHDFSLEPARPNHLTRICEAGLPVVGVGKISDVFAGRDVTRSEPTSSNADGIAHHPPVARRARRGLHLREPRRDRHALRAPQRPRRLPRQPPAVRPRAAVAARASRAGRSVRVVLRPRLRPDDGLDRSLARARPAGGAHPQPGTRAAARRLVPGRRRDRRRLARGARSGAPRLADPPGEAPCAGPDRAHAGWRGAAARLGARADRRLPQRRGRAGADERVVHGGRVPRPLRGRGRRAVHGDAGVGRDGST